MSELKFIIYIKKDTFFNFKKLFHHHAVIVYRYTYKGEKTSL